MEKIYLVCTCQSNRILFAEKSLKAAKLSCVCIHHKFGILCYVESVKLF